MKNLHFGTCSWKYDSWRGLVYSENPQLNYLQEYAQHYATVEVDQWFWSLHGINKTSLPDIKKVEEYASAVPEDFIFSIKVPNSITLTHFYHKSKDEPLVTNPHFLSNTLFTQFLERLHAIKGQLGPLMFQFEYLNKQKMESQKAFLEKFGEFINRCPKGLTYAVEIRNPNYINENYFNFLNQLKLQHVFLQGYYMPSIYSLYSKYKPLIKTGTIIRLHGPDRKGIESKTKNVWNKIVAPKDHELRNIIEMVKDLSLSGIETYLYVNNHYEGSAPLTIEKITKQLKK